MGQTETASEDEARKSRAGRNRPGEKGSESVVEECEVKRVARELKRAETRWVRCQG